MVACDISPPWSGFGPLGCCLLAVVCSSWTRDFLISCPNTLSPALLRPLPREAAWVSCSGPGSGPGRVLAMPQRPLFGFSPLPFRRLRGRAVKLHDDINHRIMLKDQDVWLFKITWSAFPPSRVASSGCVSGCLPQGRAHPSPCASPPCRLRMRAVCPERIFL